MPASPVSYTVDERRKLVETTVREGFTYADIVAYFAALRADPHVRPGFDRLVIYEASAAHLTPTQVREMVDAARAIPYGLAARIAVVVPDDVTFGMMRIYELRGDAHGLQARVFRSRAVADQWLAESPR